MSDTVRTMVQQSKLDGRAPRIVPTGAALGARVEDLDLRGLDTATFACMYQAWLDHQVLLFRDQSLTDEDLLAFSRRFGDLDEAPVQAGPTSGGLATSCCGTNRCTMHRRDAFDPTTRRVMHRTQIRRCL